MAERIIKLPDVGEGIAEAELSDWLVKVGDMVREDDVICEVTTDKATVEIPAAVSGKVTWLGGEAGDVIAIGSDLIRIEFKPFGIELSFIPRVVDNDVINLELKTAVSAIDPTNGFVNNDFQIDAFTRREATTTVEMRDGESFAIAGLLMDDFTDRNSQLPWLGDVPVLGALFRSAEYQRSQSELVIIVTPHLVTPTRGEYLALPTDRVVPPTERDLFLRGKVAGKPGQKAPNSGAAGEVAKQDFTGSYGYVMD